ncbi:MAG: hypothetical protein EOM05_12200, partial [Clostridia bacterium]|nr:hypothetical protein [Clostridia bacterium]
MKKVVSRTKKRMMLSLGASLGLFQLATSNVSAAIGDNASKLANTAQSEALGVAEAVGLVGI